MKRLSKVVLVVLSAAAFLSILPVAATAAETQADRVVVMYFHRTKRCPTCLKMGSYSEEAVRGRFAEELKKGQVEFHYIDFQDEKNAALTKGYGISGPSLVVAKITDNKVEKYENLKDIWAKVGDKPAFIQYVETHVAASQP